jgi:hypothetical protein
VYFLPFFSVVPVQSVAMPYEKPPSLVSTTSHTLPEHVPSETDGESRPPACDAWLRHRDAVDHELSRRITRKCDIRLVPILGGLYFTAFLDRVNIANAKLLGLVHDLHMPANGYNTALWVFFVSFVLLEVPCNMFLNWHRLKPNQWLGAMMFFLGS